MKADYTPLTPFFSLARLYGDNRQMKADHTMYEST